MKKSLIYFSLIFILITLSSCEKADVIPPDPPGTITTSINYTENPTPIVLYSGLAEDGPYFFGVGTTPYPYVNILVGMRASLNFVFHTAVVQNNSGTMANPIWQGLGSFGGEVVSMGKVSGLGSITTKPSSGWSTTAAVEKGHGYVIRYKASSNINSMTIQYKYARFYVVDWVTSSSVLTSGGVIGAKMKYETSF